MVQLEATSSSQPAASPTGAVVKVSYNEEVLRFRVGWPLNLNEIRSTISSTLLSSPAPSGCAGDGQEASATGTASHLVLKYSGPNDTHVELCDATAPDFIRRHFDSAQPIRLQAVAHVPSNFQQLPVTGCTKELMQTTLEGSQTASDSSSCRDAYITGSTVAAAAIPAETASQSIVQDSDSTGDDDFVIVDAEQCHEPIMAPATAVDSDCARASAGEAEIFADAGVGPSLQKSVLTGSVELEDIKADLFASLATSVPSVTPALTPCQELPKESDLYGAVEFEDIKADLSASLATSVPSVTPALTSSQELPQVSVRSAAVAPSVDSRSSPQLGSVGEEFSSFAPGGASATQTTTKGNTQGGVSLPIAARAAAYAVSDVLENARDKLSEAFSSSRSPMRSPHEAELQRALFASVELQRAIEISAAESRARLSKVLDLYKVKLRPVMADGNCQFRALSVQIYGDQSHHAAIRQRIIQQLLENRHRYEGSHLGTFEEYVKRMACDGEWGDNLSLQAASDLLNCDIQVLTDNMGLLELHPEDQQDKPQGRSLCLAFLTEVHYDAVIIETA